MLFIAQAMAIDVYSNNKTIDLKFFAHCDNHICDNSTTANISILYENLTEYVHSAKMTLSGSFFNYSIPAGAQIGIYNAYCYACYNVSCNTTSYQFKIDKSVDSISLFSRPESENYSILWLLFVLAGILILVGVIWRMMFVGIMGALSLAGLGIMLSYIMQFMGYMTIGAGVILIYYFAFVQKT